MTDYLEELLSGADGLLEEVRRAERRLALSPLGERAERVSAPGGAVRQDTPAAEEELSTEREAAHEANSGQEQTGPPDPDSPDKKGTEFPLLEQLERMERAVRTAERIGPGGGASETAETAEGRGRFPLSLSPAGGREALPAGGEGSAPGWTPVLSAEAGASVPEENWAERADRVFRRDSRRYDGGFYLY